jgi:hypothetical protein
VKLRDKLSTTGEDTEKRNVRKLPEESGHMTIGSPFRLRSRWAAARSRTAIAGFVPSDIPVAKDHSEITYCLQIRSTFLTTGLLIFFSLIARVRKMALFDNEFRIRPSIWKELSCDF